MNSGRGARWWLQRHGHDQACIAIVGAVGDDEIGEHLVQLLEYLELSSCFDYVLGKEALRSFTLLSATDWYS